jgi:hypothetical protein
MPLENARMRLVSVFAQRCVYLFFALLLLLVMAPFLEDTPRGRIVLNVVNIVILFTAAVAVSRSRVCFGFAVALAASAVGFQTAGTVMESPHFLMVSRGIGAAFYFLTVSYLLAYVLRREVLTLDKLYGAAAAFLMVGVLWAYFYIIVLHYYPAALAAGGQPVNDPGISEMLYFSFTVLTSTGFGDIVPVHPVARMLCVVEQVLGVLFIAILIARLAGNYPPMEQR